MHSGAEQDQFRRVAKDVEDAGQRQDLVKVEKESGQRDEEDRGTKSRNGARHLGAKGEQKKQQCRRQGPSFPFASRLFKTCPQ